MARVAHQVKEACLGERAMDGRREKGGLWAAFRIAAPRPQRILQQGAPCRQEGLRQQGPRLLRFLSHRIGGLAQRIQERLRLMMRQQMGCQPQQGSYRLRARSAR